MSRFRPSQGAAQLRATPPGGPRRWMSPLTRRRWANFRAHRRGYVSLWIFAILFGLSLCAELIANDKPILMSYRGGLYMPIFSAYPETEFGGGLDTEADYRDPAIRIRIEQGDGWAVWPIIPYSYRTIDYDLPTATPAPPSARHLLGTDDQARDVLARIVYGFRLLICFGLLLTVLSSAIGVTVGAIQGYFGGWTDLFVQRGIEMLHSLPIMYLLIIVNSLFPPGFFTLLTVLLFVTWMSLVHVVRAEFLRARNLDYVRAARALGVGNRAIMFRHILPNAMVATLTFLPFILSSSMTLLIALDFLGFGLPRSSPSIGELLNQAKSNLAAPWLGIACFGVMATTFSLLIFIGEAARDAFDPRKST